MNELINDVFGDQFITLECSSGECLHYTQVPGYIAPPKPDYTQWVALSSAAAASIFLLAVAGFWYAGRANSSDGFSAIRLPEDEAARLMTDHVPASLYFSNISYSIPDGKTVLSGVSGTVKSGQIMAIMGPSGAGKSTLLDILARRQKRGAVAGVTLVNGRTVADTEFKRVVGFVDQEDTLMSTLTVYETVLYSALLRLPREMSFEAKKFRTLETMHELGILGIKDSRIGDSGHRSISGGEKRRVSIACELVTSPSILFLDEPTSGLDAYNAYNVVESLVTLARDYNRTVVFTIHQPRSNIVALFDQLVVLAKGEAVYSGPYSHCQSYFEKIGFACPPGFNIADYLSECPMLLIPMPFFINNWKLVDLTMQASGETTHTTPTATGGEGSPHSEHPRVDEEHAVASNRERHPSGGSGSGTATEEPHKSNIFSQSAAFIKQTLGTTSGSSTRHGHLPKKEVHLESLVKSYRESDVAKEVRREIDSASTTNGAPHGTSTPHSTGANSRDVAEESTVLRGRRRASWTTQFRILSGRAFKNLYRNPALLAAHYAAAVIIASTLISIGIRVKSHLLTFSSVICGMLVYHVTNDIPGFQNRLGFFFFSLALFGFSCLSSLGLFANERILFMRERYALDPPFYIFNTYFIVEQTDIIHHSHTSAQRYIRIFVIWLLN